MAVGYVLINVKPGLELQAYETIKEMEGIADVDLLFGDYDIIVKIVAESMGKIAKIVVEHLRQVEGVDNTKTLAGAEV
jgi:DNA-binding Lrp family transcriptional regulator